MDFAFIYSTAILFIMLLDPFGNLPIFVATLKDIPPERYPRIVIRESFFALIAMVLVLLFGGGFLRLMQISHSSLGIAGGLILLLIGVKMVFSTFHEEKTERPEREPFIVPLAIPLICGPGLIALLITLRGGNNPGATLLNCLAALLLAWLVQTGILLCGRAIARLLGARALDALESLMGLLLTCIAVGMIVGGIAEAFHLS